MGKLVLKTAAATVSFLVAFALILFGVISLASPAAMMSFTDSLDMEGASAYYSVAVYNRTGAIDDLSVAVERSYNAAHYGDSANYGNELLNSKDFSAYCEARDKADGVSDKVSSGYRQYAYGIVSNSLYFEGDKDGALNLALAALDNSFPSPSNAVTNLSVVVMDHDDKEFCKEIIAGLNFRCTDESEQREMEKFLSELQSFCET